MRPLIYLANVCDFCAKCLLNVDKRGKKYTKQLHFPRRVQSKLNSKHTLNLEPLSLDVLQWGLGGTCEDSTHSLKEKQLGSTETWKELEFSEKSRFNM